MAKRYTTRRATLADIARAAGCSKNTVSLALRGSSRISSPVRERLLALAARMHYTPDFSAQRLRHRRSGLIGIYTRALADTVRTEIVNHLLAELHTTEYRPVLGLDDGHDGAWEESPWMQTFRELRVEAMVLLWDNVTTLPSWHKSLPTIVVGCHPNPRLPCDYLALDRREAARLGIEHLVARGHREIMIAAIPNEPFHSGAHDALSVHHGNPYRVPFSIDFRALHHARSIGFSLAQLAHPPTAVLFSDSGYAAHFQSGVLDADRHVPSQMALVAYDYFPWADILPVPLTTIEQPISSMTATTVELVRRRLAKPESPTTHLLQPHRLVIRQSS